MREKAVVFGKSSSLVGVLTEPHSGVRVSSAPAVILLNSGLLHRVGAHRLHVKLARALAEHGVTSFRFDFSGLGDSEARKDSLAFEQSGPLEVGEAMDCLTAKTGATRFVLAGLCSGADAAFYTALKDERVHGLAQLDGFAYRTWQYYARRYGPKLFKPASIKGFIEEHAGAVLKRLRKGDGPGDDFMISPYLRVFPPHETVASGLRSLVDRQVRMFSFFSKEHYIYHSQYLHCFRSVNFQDLLHLEFLPQADHTLSDTAHQQFVIQAICGWYASGWLEAAKTAATPSSDHSLGPAKISVDRSSPLPA